MSYADCTPGREPRSVAASFHLQRNRSIRVRWHGKQIDIWKNAETTQIFSIHVHHHRLIVLGLFIDVVIVNAENLCQLPVRRHFHCKLNCFVCLLVLPLASLSVWNTVFLYACDSYVRWPFIVSCLWWLWWCITECDWVFSRLLLWPPCVADADVIFLPYDFYLSSSFFLT